jgi:hypothetical protein
MNPSLVEQLLNKNMGYVYLRLVEGEERTNLAKDDSENDKHQYLMKIGRTHNIHNRMKNYKNNQYFSTMSVDYIGLETYLKNKLSKIYILLLGHCEFFWTNDRHQFHITVGEYWLEYTKTVIMQNGGNLIKPSLKLIDTDTTSDIAINESIMKNRLHGIKIRDKSLYKKDNTQISEVQIMTKVMDHTEAISNESRIKLSHGIRIKLHRTHTLRDTYERIKREHELEESLRESAEVNK